VGIDGRYAAPSLHADDGGGQLRSPAASRIDFPRSQAALGDRAYKAIAGACGGPMALTAGPNDPQLAVAYTPARAPASTQRERSTG